MSLNRIQKLLFSEYSDFEDMVLVESPFAETTREGRGIRQVQIGLTPTKLVLATDIIKKATDYPVAFFPGCIDAEIECLELISIFPIELVSLSIFRRRRRKVLKAKFHDGNPNHNSKIVYFELGGSDKRKMFWNLWCERVRFLSPEDKGGSSLTETSVASSTSVSSLHVARTRVSNDKIWQYYAGEKDIPEELNSPKNTLRWTDRDLFFGDKLETVDTYKLEPISYSTLLQNDTDEVRTLYRHKQFPLSKSSISSSESKEVIDSPKKGGHRPINRFGEGIDERCKTGLYLPAISYSEYSIKEQESVSNVGEVKTKTTPSAFKRLCEEGVELWESAKKPKSDRHPRLYGLKVSSELEYCFGKYFLGPGESFSMQVKKSPSAVFLHDEKIDEKEFEKPTNRFHLCNSPSHESFRPWGIHPQADRCPIYFWTTDCWYRPNSLKNVYKECQAYLNQIRLFLKKRNSNSSIKIRKCKFMNFGRKLLRSSKIFYLNSEESSADMKKKLKMNNLVSVWDIDSSTLAFQITMIDAQLFLKVPISELRLLLKHKNGKSSLNLMNWLLFSHRVSCLITTEIIRTDDVKFRARLISRFINAAEKCHLLHNYQSCKSLLNGLQSPAIYRLKKTWCHVRRHHATKYQMFERLCRLYKDPRLFCYQKSFYKSTHQQPYLPSAGHLFAVLLGQVFEQPVSESWSSSTLSQSVGGRKKISIVEQCRAAHHNRNAMPKILKQILSALRIYSSEKSGERSDAERSSSHSSCDKNAVEVKSFFQNNETVKHFSNGIEDAEELFKNAQKAVTKYDLGENDSARDFLLKVPYREQEVNFISSFRIEPD